MLLIQNPSGTMLLAPVSEGAAQYAQIDWHMPDGLTPFVSVRTDLVRLIAETANLRHHSVGRAQVMALSLPVVDASLTTIPAGIIDMEWDRDSSADVISVSFPFTLPDGQRFAVQVNALRFLECVNALGSAVKSPHKEV